MTEANTYSFYLPDDLVDRLRHQAKAERRTLSNMARMAIEQYVDASPACPACGKTTFQKDGVHWCEHCNMAVTVAQCPTSLT